MQKACSSPGSETKWLFFLGLGDQGLLRSWTTRSEDGGACKRPQRPRSPSGCSDPTLWMWSPTCQLLGQETQVESPIPSTLS